MTSSCVFEFNNSLATYFCGETVSGTIILNTSKEIYVRDIGIALRGEGKTRWSAKLTRATNAMGNILYAVPNTNFRSHSVYVNNITSVQGNGILPAGKHSYTFNITLPPECPTSLEGSFGHIRYEILLKISSYNLNEEIFKKPITVIKNNDLNLNPFYKQPIIVETAKKARLFWASGKIFYTLKVPFGAYAPGQNLQFTIHIVNESMTDIVGYYFKFTKNTIFIANIPHHKELSYKETLVHNILKRKYLRLTNCIIEEQMLIPSIPPTNDGKSIIGVEYKLKVALKLSHFRSNMSIEVPIVIGTIPIRESFEGNQNTNIQTPQEIASNQQDDEWVVTEEEFTSHQDDAIDELPPRYSEIPPPTFEEAMANSTSKPFVDSCIEGLNNIVDFKPLYPMYKN